LPAFGVPLGPRSGGALRERDPKVTGLFAAFGAYLAWGLLPIYFKALRPLPPLEILSHRVVWSVLLLAAVVAARNGWRELAGALRGWRRLATFSGTTLLIGSNWLTYIWAVNSGQLLQASLGYFVNPLVNVLLGVVLLRESLNRRQAVAVCLAAAGVLWLVLGYGRFPWISLFLAFSFGLYGLVRKVAGIGAVSGLLVETALLAPLALAYLLSRARDGSGAFGSGWRPTLLLLAAGVITAIPLVWFTVGVQRLRLSTMGVLQYLAPSLQFALAVWLYGEPFTRAHVATFACIWVSLAIYSWDALTARRAGPAVEPLD
jgi:chloramphenicol-sensitive protein RarD